MSKNTVNIANIICEILWKKWWNYLNAIFRFSNFINFLTANSFFGSVKMEFSQKKKYFWVSD